MISKIENLSSWLFTKGLHKEGFHLYGMAKTAAGKPLPINRAEMEQVIDELLAGLSARFLAYPSFSPFELFGVLSGQYSLDDFKIPPIIRNPTAEQQLANGSVLSVYRKNLSKKEERKELQDIVDRFKRVYPEKYKDLTVNKLEEQLKDSKEQYMTNYLETKVEKKKENIKGDDVSVTYILKFSDNPSLPPGMTGASMEIDGDRTVVLGFNPNPGLLSRIEEFFQNNSAEYRRSIGNRPKEIEFFTKSIRSYLLEVLRHEEVHVKDVISPDKKHGEKYTVSDSNGESVEEIARKLEVDPYPLFAINLMPIISDINISITPHAVLRAVSDMAAGNPRPMSAIFDHAKNKKLKKDFVLFVPPRAQSQIMTSKDGQDTLRSIAERTGIKHGAMRLLVINFNHIFAPRLSLDPNRGPVGPTPSYQDILDGIPDYIKERLIDTPLPEGQEVKLVPSYGELYAYDRAFYLITKEEGQAHYEQIIYQIQKVFKDRSLEKPEVESMTVYDMIELSDIAREYKKLKENPVDKLIKTPIGYLDVLKKNRMKTFLERMHYMWTNRLNMLKEVTGDSQIDTTVKNPSERARDKVDPEWVEYVQAGGLLSEPSGDLDAEEEDEL